MNASSGSGIRFPLTIGQRLLAMVIIFVLALGAILAFTHTAVKTLELDVVVMDVAGRQRMMIQRHLNEMLLVSHEIRTDFQRTQQALLHSADALRNGGEVVVNPFTDERRSIPEAPTARIRELLDQQRSLLEQFFVKTKTLLLEDPDHSPSSESFSLLSQLHDELQRNADTVFKLFSDRSRQNIVNLLRSEPVIGFLVILLSLVLARQVVSASRRLEREIEQRKQAEDARKAYEEELVLRDRSINSATNGILIADARQPDMPTVYCNAAFEKITGYAAAEVLGRNCRFLQGTDHQQPGIEAIRLAIRQGTGGPKRSPQLRKDGSCLGNELYIRRRKVNRDKHRRHFIGFPTDIKLRNTRRLNWRTKRGNWPNPTRNSSSLPTWLLTTCRNRFAWWRATPSYWANDTGASWIKTPMNLSGTPWTERSACNGSFVTCWNTPESGRRASLLKKPTVNSCFDRSWIISPPRSGNVAPK